MKCFGWRRAGLDNPGMLPEDHIAKVGPERVTLIPLSLTPISAPKTPRAYY